MIRDLDKAIRTVTAATLDCKLIGGDPLAVAHGRLAIVALTAFRDEVARAYRVDLYTLTKRINRRLRGDAKLRKYRYSPRWVLLSFTTRPHRDLAAADVITLAKELGALKAWEHVQGGES